MHKARHALCYTVYCEEFVLAIFAPSQILLCSIVRCVVGRFCTDPHTYIHTATLLLARLAVVRQCPSVRFFPVFKKKTESIETDPLLCLASFTRHPERWRSGPAPWRPRPALWTRRTRSRGCCPRVSTSSFRRVESSDSMSRVSMLGAWGMGDLFCMLC